MEKLGHAAKTPIVKTPPAPKPNLLCKFIFLQIFSQTKIEFITKNQKMK
jgi:hypothetical protein